MAKVTKAGVIRGLYESGVRESSRIATLTGYDAVYVRNVVCGLNSPGRMARWQRDYWKRKGRSSRSKYNAQWLKAHPEQAREFRRKRYHRKQKASRHSAWANGTAWTTRQLKFLRRRRGRMSVTEMARSLGRTYGSVRRALTVYELAASRPRPVSDDWNTPEFA